MIATSLLEKSTKKEKKNIMEFIKEDWKLFRNLDTLQQKAGVVKYELGKLIAKELTDNALDVSNNCEIGLIGGNGFYVKDDGTGIDIDKIEDLFSINRPMITNKLLRLPTRGALGNGLRVVSGTIYATNSELYISTKGKKFKIHIQDNGTSTKEYIEEYNGTGTKIEVILKNNSIQTNLECAENAIKYNVGEDYKGSTSAYWYTSEAFFELLQAYTGTARDLLTRFEGCTGAKAGKITEGFSKGKLANTFTFEESEMLLGKIREMSKQVKTDRLGNVGEIEGYKYYKIGGYYKICTSKGKFDAEIPYIVEVNAEMSESPKLTVLVNKTPIVGDILWYESKKHMVISGCGILGRNKN